MMKLQTDTSFSYKDLHEIRVRKEMIRREIQTDDVRIKALWNELFHPRRSPADTTTPSKRLSRFINTSAGILDGAILGWKLYQKFKKMR